MRDRVCESQKLFTRHIPVNQLKLSGYAQKLFTCHIPVNQLKLSGYAYCSVGSYVQKIVIVTYFRCEEERPRSVFCRTCVASVCYRDIESAVNS